jgi:glucose/arabinose dehydrogenase
MASKPFESCQDHRSVVMCSISECSRRAAVIVACTLCVLVSERASGQVRRGEAAFGGWQDDKPGVRRLITPQDLPPISAATFGNGHVVPVPAGGKPQVPSGFSVERVTPDLPNARVIRVAPNGDLFVASSMSNTVHVMRIPAGSATPQRSTVFASGLRQPYGIAFYPLGANPQWVYVANSDGLVRFPYKNGDLVATGPAERMVSGIPSAHHWSRDVVVSPDGTRLYFSVGSGSNAAQDMFPVPHLVMSPAPRTVAGLAEWLKIRPAGSAWDSEELRANVLSFDPSGKDMRIVATGMRNCAGMTIQPATQQLWCIVNERDSLGNNTPFDYATHVVEGAFYGWPWYYIGAHQDPRQVAKRPDLKGKITVPDVLLQAHSAPLQIVFYPGGNFPAEYTGSAFATMHGSWNRSTPTGYKVVRLLFDGSGKPTGEYEDFMTGFVVSDTQVWGYPVGVAVAHDGSLFVSEDGNGTIWRVSYQGSARTR